MPHFAQVLVKATVKPLENSSYKFPALRCARVCDLGLQIDSFKHSVIWTPRNSPLGFYSAVYENKSLKQGMKVEPPTNDPTQPFIVLIASGNTNEFQWVSALRGHRTGGRVYIGIDPNTGIVKGIDLSEAMRTRLVSKLLAMMPATRVFEASNAQMKTAIISKGDAICVAYMTLDTDKILAKNTWLVCIHIPPQPLLHPPLHFTSSKRLHAPVRGGALGSTLSWDEYATRATATACMWQQSKYRVSNADDTQFDIQRGTSCELFKTLSRETGYTEYKELDNSSNPEASFAEFAATYFAQVFNSGGNDAKISGMKFTSTTISSIITI